MPKNPHVKKVVVIGSGPIPEGRGHLCSIDQLESCHHHDR